MRHSRTHQCRMRFKKFNLQFCYIWNYSPESVLCTTHYVILLGIVFMCKTLCHIVGDRFYVQDTMSYCWGSFLCARHYVILLGIVFMCKTLCHIVGNRFYVQDTICDIVGDRFYVQETMSNCWGSYLFLFETQYVILLGIVFMCKKLCQIVGDHIYFYLKHNM